MRARGDAGKQVFERLLPLLGLGSMDVPEDNPASNGDDYAGIHATAPVMVELWK